MRIKTRAILLAIFVSAAGARAQGVVTPPVSSFGPDTSMPSVKVPEFVITGKTQVELPKAAKPVVRIDSEYFQKKDLRGVAVEVPMNRAISSQNLTSENQSTSLFARASVGHYTTTHYLVSGAGGVGGFGINGSISGDYTSGFIPGTMRRDFAIQAGITRDINSQEQIRSSNSMDLSYARSSYSLYGGPRPFLQRSTAQTKFDVISDMYLGRLPLAFGLNFDRFSINDFWQNSTSSLKLGASTQIQLQSGWLGFNGSFLFGNHDISNSPAVISQPVPIGYYLSQGLNRSIYNLRLGGSYGNSSLLGIFSYSVGANYYQYRDDTSNTVAKIFPDLRASYRIDQAVSLFASFNGSVSRADLSSFVSNDMYVDGAIPLVNTQLNADFAFGARLAATDYLMLMPELRIRSAKYFPIFISPPGNLNRLLYAGKAEITSLSVEARYNVSSFSARMVLRYEKTSADSLSSIPNIPAFDANFGLTYKITRHLTAEAGFLFLSARYADLSLSNKVDPVGLLNIRLAYDFKFSEIPFEVFGGGNNILNQRYFIWQGYREFPLTLYIGLSSKIL